MAMFSIKVDTNLDELESLLKRVKAAQNASSDGPMKVLGAAGLALVKDSFAKGVDAEGNRFYPLKASTIEGRKRQRKSRRAGTKVLVNTGKLRSSFNYQVIPGSGVEIGTPFGFYKYHQQFDTPFGGPSAGILPKRAVLPNNDSLPKRWQTELVESMEEYLMEGGNA